MKSPEGHGNRAAIEGQIDQLKKEQDALLESLKDYEKERAKIAENIGRISEELKKIEPKKKNKAQREKLQQEIEALQGTDTGVIDEQKTMGSRVNRIEEKLKELADELIKLGDTPTPEDTPKPEDPAKPKDKSKDDPKPKDPPKDTKKPEEKSKPDKKEDRGAEKKPEKGGGVKFPDEGYLSITESDIGILYRSAKTKKDKIKTISSPKKRALIKKEAVIREEHAQKLQELLELATNGKELKLDLDDRPDIDAEGFDDRPYAEKWEDEKYIEALIRDINDLNDKIDKKIDILEDETDKAKIKILEKEIAIYFKHIEILGQMADKALGKESTEDEDVEEAEEDDEEGSDEDDGGDSDDDSRQGDEKDVKSNEDDTSTNMRTRRSTVQESGVTPPPLPPEAFNIRSAFNRAGFREYLMEFAEKNGRDIEHDIETENYEYIQQRYEAFTKSEGSKRQLRELFAKEIKNDLGITLEKEAFDDIDAYIDEARKENPAEIIDISDSIQEYGELAVEIERGETELAQLKRELDRYIESHGGDEELRAMEVVMRQQKVQYHEYLQINSTSALKPWKNFGERRAAALEIGETDDSGFLRWAQSKLGIMTGSVLKKELDRLSTEINQAVATINPIRELQLRIRDLENTKEQAETRYTAIRMMIFEKADASRKIQNAAQKKVQDEIKGMLDMTDKKKRKLTDVEKQQELLDRARSASEFGVPTYLDESEIDDFQQRLDEVIVQELNEEIDEAINANKKETSGAFDSLEKSLSKFALKQRLGSKEGVEALDFILETLETKKGELKAKGNKEDSAKAISLSLIIRNIRAGY